MRLRVEYASEILGNAVFWEGDVTDTGEIRNIPARMCADKAARDGKTCKYGMWVARIIGEIPR